MLSASGKIYLSISFFQTLKNPTLEKSLTDHFYQCLGQFTEALHFCQIFVDRMLSTRRSTKGAAHCYFRRAI